MAGLLLCEQLRGVGRAAASHAAPLLVDIPSDNLAAVFRVMLASLKLLQDAVQEIEQVQGRGPTRSGRGSTSSGPRPPADCSLTVVKCVHVSVLVVAGGTGQRTAGHV